MTLNESYIENHGLLAFGGYLYVPIDNLKLKCELTFLCKGKQFKETWEVKLNKGWNRIGKFWKIKLENKKIDLTNIKLKLNPKNLESVEIDTYGLVLDRVSFEIKDISKDEQCLIFNDIKIKYNHKIANSEKLTRKNFEEEFLKKTTATIPEIFFFIHEEYNSNTHGLNKKNPLVLKSCNRCGRFLPINILKEVKTLSFALHCKTKAPCEHKGFSMYEIVNYKDLKTQDFKSLGNFIKLSKINNKYYMISKHGHQIECKACKKFFVNLPLNPKRTPEQHREDSSRRRALEELLIYLYEKEKNQEYVYYKYKKMDKNFLKHLFEKFNGKCFKCETSLEFGSRGMHADHTFPLKYLYPLDENATLLCDTCNSQKNDIFPKDFYSEEQLKDLSKITGIDYEKLKTLNTVNEEAVKFLKENIEWFFEVFLKDKKYQKIKDGKLIADLILKSIHEVIDEDLVECYYNKTGKYPDSITLNKK